MNRSLFFVVAGLLFISITSVSKKKKVKQNELAALGKLLFFDPALSINKSKSCASCHNPDLFFTDGYRRAIGTYGDVMARNTPSLINSVALKSFNWANPTINTYQQQMITPLFSAQHLEMGMHQNNTDEAFSILSKKMYAPFIHQKEKNWTLIINALAAYQITLVSRNSKYDLYKKGKATLTIAEQKGEQLFFSTKLNCAQCHGGIDFNTPTSNNNRFVNTGIYKNNEILYGDSGLANYTKRIEDIGKFRIPSLRNVAATAPYYHDGSGASLVEVITNYANSANNEIGFSNKHVLINGFKITNSEKKSLVLFLNTLTDSSILKKIKSPY